MSIQLTCPTGHTLKIADAWAGRAGRCPVCKAVVQVPAPQPPRSDPPLASPALAAASPPAPPPPNGPTAPPPLPEPPHPTAAAAAPAALERKAIAAAGLRKPPPLPAAAVSATADSLSKAAVDHVVAEIGSASEVDNHRTPKKPAVVASGYQPDADKRWTVYYLAAAMAALSVFCIAPALPHWNLGTAPNWARAVLLLSLLQLAYGAWVASIPDWATLRSSMILLTIVAALYGLTMTVALTTPPEHTLPLDLTDVRRQAVLWCAGVVLLACLLVYFCGRAAWRWQRTLERVM